MLHVVEQINDLTQSIGIEIEKNDGKTTAENDIELTDELDIMSSTPIYSSNYRVEKSKFIYLFTDILFKPLLESPPPR